MEGIHYFPPTFNKMRQDGYQGHSFEVVSNGQKIGAAEVNYYSKPIPLYQISHLYIDGKEQGRGLASRLFDQVEAWLKERGKPGVLFDAIDGKDLASGMYERRGWRPVPETGLYVYNWPPAVDVSVLGDYPVRYVRLPGRDTQRLDS